jgi:6-phosphogluconolactonase
MASQRNLKLGLGFLLGVATAVGAPSYLYVGNYSNAIQAYSYDAASSALQSLGPVGGEIERPSFLTIHPNGRFLYAVSELGNDAGREGYVYSYSIDKATGKLTFINRQSSGGGGACHLVVNKTGKFLLVANYGSGSVADFPLKEDGSIGARAAKVQFEGSGPDQKRQKGPHAHAVVLSSDDRFLFVPDLGADKVRIFKFDSTSGALTAKYAYALAEMGSSVTAFRVDSSSGSLTQIEAVSTLPDDNTKVNNSAEIQIDRAGKFLYASNRGHNSVAVFAIDSQTGKLNRVGVTPTEGATPRNFTLDPAGTHILVANQDSNNIVLFQRDQKTGKLTPAGKVFESPSPVCLIFYPAR